MEDMLRVPRGPIFQHLLVIEDFTLDILLYLILGVREQLSFWACLNYLTCFSSALVFLQLRRLEAPVFCIESHLYLLK